jgi:hypothetical protein
MLKSLDRANIKRMSIESTEEKTFAWFSPEQLLDADKQSMESKLESERANNNWWGFAYLASDMRSLGLSVEISDTDKQNMESQLESERANNNWRGFAYLASDMRSLGLSVEISDTDKQSMESQLESERANNNWWGFAYLASDMHQLAQSEPKKALDLNQTPPIPEQRNY